MSAPVLVIPDVHQNDAFLRRIFDQEDPESYQSIVFLGDFLDAKDMRFDSSDCLQRTLGFVQDLISKFPGKIEILIGNHDFLYVAHAIQLFNGFTDKTVVHDYYGLPNKRYLKLIEEHGFGKIWAEAKIVTSKQGFLISHAGIADLYWDDSESEVSNIDRINSTLGQPVLQTEQLSPILCAGSARGGHLKKGGPLWLDWVREFEDSLVTPQIVGHTIGEPFRKNGRSYCLDAKQTIYGIVHNSRLDIRSIV